MNPGSDEARTLLRLAAQDWEILRLIENAPSVELPGVCFHAQQCVEKSLKAVIALRGLIYERTHNLELLGDLLEQNGVVLPVDVDVFSLLNPCAVTYRYEDREMPFLEREDAMDIATTVLNWARSEAGVSAVQ